MTGATSFDSLSSLRALVSDAYVNLKVNLKLELTKSRETVLELFDRVRRQYPTMSEFDRNGEELALDTHPGDFPYRWLAIRSRNIRSGIVNPDALTSAHELHRLVLEVIPYYLSISPLDVESIELLFGADISAKGNHDEIVFSALVADSPLANLLSDGCTITDCQPVLTSTIPGSPGLEAQFEVKTRCHGSAQIKESQHNAISVYLTIRRPGPITNIEQLDETYLELARQGERLVEDTMIPSLVVPIRHASASFS
ncbi:MAG TPA: hypothetical protein ENJ00_09345 [Phycisphaerales bacterium]|nr:hypothetical protein [Phycisphaerales bacterium]